MNKKSAEILEFNKYLKKSKNQVFNVIEPVDNKIYLTQEQIDTKQLSIEVIYDIAILEKDEEGNIVLQNVFDANGTLLKRYSEFDDVEYEPGTYYFSADNLGYTTSTGNIQIQFRGLY